jgi:putative sigma-54 modulation protein
MNVKFRAKGFEFTEGAKAAITDKLEKISYMFNLDTVFDVCIVKRDKDYKCEIKVQRGKDFIRSEEIGRTIEFSVENAIGELKRRARKLKAIKISKKRVTIEDTVLSEEVDAEENVTNFNVERYKSVKLLAMTEEEAILELEALNHSFFIFKNKENKGRTCVVYRRETGYGVIETY